MLLVVLLVAIAALLLAALCPWHKSTRKFISGKYAHRGLHDGANAENSLEAFQRAVKAGYGIELDVRLSSDGEVMVFHDDTLKRACGRPERVDTHSADELAQMEIFDTRCHIPTFDQVLQTVNGKVPLVVEIKTGGSRQELCEKTAKLLEAYRGDYCVESFDPRVLLWFRKNSPDVIRGQLAMNFLKDRQKGMPLLLAVILSGMLTNFITRPDFIAYKLDDRHDLPFMLCRKLFREPAAAWTVRSWDEEKKSAQLFDAVIFENFRP